MPRYVLPGLLAALLPAAAAGQPALTPDALQKIKAATVKIQVVFPGGSASGSGFVVRTEGDTAWVVTNDHVIDVSDNVPGGPNREIPKPDIAVVFDSGTGKERSVKATVAATAAPLADLAVLRVAGVKDIPKPLDLSDPPKVQETLEVLVCGFPFGQRNIDIGKASVSSIRTDPASGRVTYIQLTGALNPGNSGGPILTADGKLVGVAVMTIRNAGKGLAIPQEQVAGMLRGEPGNVRLVPAGEGMAKLEVDVIDPLGKMKSIVAHYKPAEAGMAALKPEKLEVMPGATKLPLAVKNGVATGEVKLPAGKKQELVVQVEMEVADGRILTFPGLVAPSAPAGPGMVGRAPRIQLPSGQVLPPPTFRRPPGGDDTLTEIIGNPESFVGKVVEFDALSSGSVNQQGDKYELVIETDAEKTPSNLRPVVAKDLALQLADLGIPDPYKFAVRLKGKVEKPAGRDDRHLIEVREVGFLDPSGKVETTLKPEAGPPAGKPSLSGLNRFPEKYVGQVLTVDGIVKGAKFAGQGFPLDIANENEAVPMNLEFYTSKQLHDQLASGVPNSGAVAKLTLAVERVDAKTGKGVVGVTKAELTVPDEKGALSTKKYSTSEKISFPAAGVAAKPKPPVGDKSPAGAAPSPAPAPGKADAPPADKGGGNTLLLAMIGAAIFAGLGGSAVALLLLRKKSAAPPRYGRAAAPAEDDDESKAAPKPAKSTARSVRKPAAEETKREEFPGFDFEN